MHFKGNIYPTSFVVTWMLAIAVLAIFVGTSDHYKEIHQPAPVALLLCCKECYIKLVCIFCFDEDFRLCKNDFASSAQQGECNK